MEKSKRTDKFIYAMILTMGIITIVIMSYFIVFGTMNLINGTEVSKILIDMNIYQTFYDILNTVSAMMIPILLTIVFMSIPYIIISIILGKIFIKKYKSSRGRIWFYRYRCKRINKYVRNKVNHNNDIRRDSICLFLSIYTKRI